ncbi:palmitoyltransferase PFA3 [Entamoeba marina]
MNFLQTIKKWDYDTTVSICVILIIYAISFIINFIDVLTLYSQFNVTVLSLLHLLCWILSFLSFLRCVFTDVSVPTHLQKEPNTYPLCPKCNKYKPERTHHCKECKQCIFGMDHHCAYIGNCVGYHNKKYFMLFLLYTSLLTLVVFLISSPITILSFVYPSPNPFHSHVFRLFDIIHIVLASFAGCILFPTLYVMLKGLFRNQTAIEVHIQGDLGWKCSKKSLVKNKYDIGTLNNIRQVFGDNLFVGLLPIPSNLHCNGYVYQYNTYYNENLDKEYEEYYEDW